MSEKYGTSKHLLTTTVGGEEFKLLKGITQNIAEQLITLSTDENDEVLKMSVPNDKKRFGTQEKLQDWYNDGIDIGRQRHFYYMENAEGKLAAIVWLRKSDLPVMMSDAKEKLSQILSTERSENIDFHTEAFRVYPPFRGGRGLGSIILRESTEEYKKAGNKGIIIGDVDEGNIASQKTHVNAQYMLLGHGEAAKTGSHGEKRLLYAKVI